MVEKIAFLPITATMVFVASFSIGFGPLPWVMNSELFPREAKALGSSIGRCSNKAIKNHIFCAGTMLNWTCAFLVVYFYPLAETALSKYYCYFFFALVCLIGAIFIVIFVPETKGKTEEDMKNYFLKQSKDSNTHVNYGYE